MSQQPPQGQPPQGQPVYEGVPPSSAGVSGASGQTYSVAGQPVSTGTPVQGAHIQQQQGTPQYQQQQYQQGTPVGQPVQQQYQQQQFQPTPGQNPNYVQNPQGQTTVVVAGAPPPVYMAGPRMGAMSSRTTCPYCHADVATTVTKECGTMTWVATLVLVFLAPLCFYIPLISDSCKDTVHSCPNCARIIAVCPA